MHILLCNDDGYRAQGLQILATTLRAQNHRVTIVAPHEERSGQSHAVSFFKPVMVQQMDNETYAVHGTPADCVMIGILDLLKDDLPDVVVSGTNHGLNVGLDVHYSGTVGAASEAAFLGYPAIACSADLHEIRYDESAVHKTFTETADLVCQILEQMPQLPTGTILNLNHPGGVTKGIRATNSGALALYRAQVAKMHSNSERCHAVYMIGGETRRSHDCVDQDVTAIQQGFVSLSLLSHRTGGAHPLVQTLTQGVSLR